MKRNMQSWVAILMCLSLAVFAGATFAKEKAEKAAEKRAEIDAMAAAALSNLFAKSPNAKALYDKAVGYAVFDNLKIAVGISGGGGSGVAVSKAGERTYMKMGTGGIGFGLGGQKYQLIFLFETNEAFRSFVDKGWKADTSAQAAAADKGANVGASFNQGIAYYQLTEAGLIASADISGTKYWKNDDLNEKK